jgi:ABC-type transport system involved in cytochrome c biogenesis permease subunit
VNRRVLIVGMIACGLAAAWLGYRAMPKPLDDQFDLDSFAQIPVQHGGRFKPMDSLARTALLLISDKRTFVDTEGNRQPAIRFLLDVKTAKLGNADVLEHRVIRIDSEALLDAIGLEQRKRFRYSLGEVNAVGRELAAQINAASAVDEDDRNLYQQKVVELGIQLDQIEALNQWLAPAMFPQDGTPDWKTFSQALHDEHRSGKAEPLVVAFDNVLTTWAQGDAAMFNGAVMTYLDMMRQVAPDAVQQAATEYRYNRINPLYVSATLYVAVLLLVSVGWLFRWRSLMGGAVYLTVFTIAIHTAALVIRMYLQGRPPVTNLYSSAVFVGWGTVLLGLALEYFYRNGIGTMLAAVTGFATLVVAINLETQANGETLDVMQAVLDTNFWLATHVTTVTIGYSATYVAGLLGIAYIIGRQLPSRMDADDARSLSRMIYGVVCFGLLFSFVGTILGGIWADQSWGRFWGWDPKENGALMIVIWNALILHARWGGIVKQRGVALLAVGGNIITTWSWFGVNQLGVGLHSYGFMDSAVFWILVFVASQLLVIGLGLLPARRGNAAAPAASTV